MPLTLSISFMNVCGFDDVTFCRIASCNVAPENNIFCSLFYEKLQQNEMAIFILLKLKNLTPEL